ncbi:hypothetical protein F5B20DRAFT_585968 [Whalleya microplaca]|nr:hypothetical protein F5B20DRAFT_585968 [Whalleya microplaca]
MDVAILDRLAHDKKKAKKWYALAELMRGRCFSLRWIVQEITFVKEGIPGKEPSENQRVGTTLMTHFVQQKLVDKSKDLVDTATETVASGQHPEELG